MLITLRARRGPPDPRSAATRGRRTDVCFLIGASIAGSKVTPESLSYAALKVVSATALGATLCSRTWGGEEFRPGRKEMSGAARHRWLEGSDHRRLGGRPARSAPGRV